MHRSQDFFYLETGHCSHDAGLESGAQEGPPKGLRQLWESDPGIKHVKRSSFHPLAIAKEVLLCQFVP